jgi:hypothetical protein
MPSSSCARRGAMRAAASIVAGLAAPCGVARAQPRTASADAAARDALAPTGRLRAALILSNPVLVQRDAPSGSLGGVSVELARALWPSASACRWSRCPTPPRRSTPTA